MAGDVRARLAQPRAQAVSDELALEPLQREEDRGQRAGRAVVQVLGDPPALALLRLDDARRASPARSASASRWRSGASASARARSRSSARAVRKAIAPSGARASRSSWSRSPNEPPSSPVDRQDDRDRLVADDHELAP